MQTHLPIPRPDQPLAARMRPRTLSEYIGQSHILGPGRLLRRAIEADRISQTLPWASTAVLLCISPCDGRSPGG